MKKILMVTNIAAPGGAENQIFLLLKSLAAQKQFDLSIAFFKVEQPEIANTLKKAGVKVIDLNAPQKMSLKPYQKLKALMIREHYEIVHSHLIYPDFICALVHRAYPHFKLIRTLHNCESIFNFMPYQWFNRLFLNTHFAFTVCISKAVQNMAQKNLGITAQKNEVIYYGISVSSSKPAEISQNSLHKKLSILFLARLVPQKNHPLLFRVLTDLRDKPLAVFLAGNGRKYYENKLKNIVKKNHLEEMVQFLGFKSDTQKLMAECDVLILPSLWEGFGLVLLEAMAQAKPIIASDIAPINEVVVNGETGWLFKNNDVEHLKQTLLNVLQNQSELKTRGQNGQKRAEQLFNIDLLVQKMTNRYKHL